MVVPTRSHELPLRLHHRVGATAAVIPLSGWAFDRFGANASGGWLVAVSIGGSAPRRFAWSPARWSSSGSSTVWAPRSRSTTKLACRVPMAGRSQPSPIDHRTARRGASSGAMEISVLLRTTGNGDGPRALPMSTLHYAPAISSWQRGLSPPLPRFSESLMWRCAIGARGGLSLTASG